MKVYGPDHPVMLRMMRATADPKALRIDCARLAATVTREELARAAEAAISRQADMRHALEIIGFQVEPEEPRVPEHVVRAVVEAACNADGIVLSHGAAVGIARQALKAAGVTT